MLRTWLPTSQFVISGLEDHPPGTLVFPFEPYRTSEAAVGIRVDHEESSAVVRQMVYSLHAWPDGHTCSGELILPQPMELFVGWRLSKGQRLFIESDIYAGSIEEGARNPRGALLRFTPAGVRLTGLRDARGHSYGSRPTTYSIDPASWRVQPPETNHNGIMYQEQWRLRLQLSDCEVITVAEAGGSAPRSSGNK